MSAGSDLLNAYALATRREREGEELRVLVAQLRDELTATKQRLANTSAAYEALSLDAQMTADALHMPSSDSPHDRLAALRDAPHAALAQLREMDGALAHYRTEGAPTYLPALLEWVITRLQQGRGGAA